MKTKKLNGMATHDAHEWARAEMFFGEGAGVRRRHLDAEINTKMATIPGYLELFNQAYEAQDMASHAIAAAKERKKIDAMAKAGKNFRALKSGNLQNLSTGVFVAAGGAYLLHATGYDKVLEAEAKKAYKKVKTEIKYRKARMEGRNVEKLFG